MAYISGSLKGAPKSLVEFPGVLLPAFQSTLVALQEMIKTEDLPFTELLIPGTNTADVPPPAYAIEKGFAYDISCLANKGSKLILDVAHDFDAMVAEVRTRTSLDDMQASAFVSALTQSFALIQGPPGTGKSYTGVALMRALLANKDSASLGPIITVAQTSHALDQLLESLLDAGVTQIIRMGQFSKSDRLRNLNLRCVAEQVTQTRAEKSAWGKTRSATEAEARAINELLHSISQIESAAGVERYLEANFPEHGAQMFGGIDDEGFEAVNYGPGYSLHAWLSASVTVADLSDRPLEELFEINIHETSPYERRRLWNYWMQDCSGRLHGQLRIALQAYGELKQELTKISNDKDLRVLSQADVVGVTTAGLARNLNLFRKLGSRILLIEEAAEILESHTLSAMLPSLEHCIQIGDHLQLRPRVANYELSIDNPKSHYAMDISLFERLIHPAQNDRPLPYTTLNIQRRMHPSISSLIGSLYPNLQDHPRVVEHPQVMGIRHRLWWLDHNHREDARDAFSNSFTNTFEVEFCAGLISHLVRQGIYHPADIAVLTPYLGQLRALRARLRTSFAIEIDSRDQDELDLDHKGGVLDDDDDDDDDDDGDVTSVATRMAPLTEKIRLATVDNFQGEEAKVVIVSLVRSNEERNAGFLKTPNRINVLLSRAQHGMYVLGNKETQRSSSPMWQKVTDKFQEAGAIGNSLDLDCPRHPDMMISVSEPDDFASAAPEAGCSKSCSLPMVCGHQCPKKCHSDTLHKVTVCTEPSDHILSCGHKAGTVCSEKLPTKCTKLISGIQVELPCGHTKTSLPCWQQQQPDNERNESMGEASLNKDPYVFLSCRHFFPASAMDKHMKMGDYYDLDHASRPSKTKLLDDVELATSIPGCPTCGKAVDNIGRYSRCVKAARLGVSAKKIVESIEKTHKLMHGRAISAINSLKATVATAAIPQQAIALCGEREQQLAEVFKLDKSMNTMRYEAVDHVRKEIYRWGSIVQNMTKPFDVLRERMKAKIQDDALNENTLHYLPQLAGLLMLPAALIELCDLAIITDVVARAEKKKGQNSQGLRVDFKTNRVKCERLIQQAKETTMMVQQVQGMAIWAQYALLESRVGAPEHSMSNRDLDAEAAIRIADAEELVSDFNFPADKREDGIDLHHAREAMQKVRQPGHMNVPVITEVGLPEVVPRSRWFRYVNSHVFAGHEEDGDDAVCYHCGECVTDEDAGDEESEGSDTSVGDDEDSLISPSH
ncbi:hypothetical protein LTR86_000014 [Recurvomyces mirabilis]|nr:hypothetical protein LTR86_000014 [Recurvomyces mirabilis]